MAVTQSQLVAGGEIHGARVTKLNAHRDCRGSLTEIFKDRWQLGIKPVQWSLVHSKAGVLRGMHLHRRHDEYIMVVSGRASVGLRDLRPDSPTSGAWSLIELNGEEPTCLSFPRSVVHGWYSHEDTVHLQAVSEDFETYGDDDNFGCRWDDPDLQIPWPQENAILSARAESFPSLQALLDLLRSDQVVEAASKIAKAA